MDVADEAQVDAVVQDLVGRLAGSTSWSTMPGSRATSS